MTFTTEETATILAALRYWQHNVRYADRHHLPHFDECCPLDDYGIDRLCERINCNSGNEVQP